MSASESKTPSASESKTPLAAGSQAPDFELHATPDQKVTLADCLAPPAGDAFKA